MSTTERLARSLLLYAARCAPPALSERLAEEWLADFEARGGGWGVCAMRSAAAGPLASLPGSTAP